MSDPICKRDIADEPIDQNEYEAWEREGMKTEMVAAPAQTVEVDDVFFAKLTKAKAKLDRKRRKA